jgi:FAD/FMN-containing dehydrogenase/Fe-S oxidoreductase
MSLVEISPTRVRPGDLVVDYARDLESELRQRVEGEVRFTDGDRALYATDASNYRQVPIGVVIPRSVDDVITTVATARRFGAPILARGGGTSLAGQCCNVAVVLDFSKYLNHLLELDPFDRFARVQPGIVLDHLQGEAGKWKLTFGPDPATHNHCTLGGMIGNNACGIHALMAGKTEENVEELDILTYDGIRMTVGKTSDDELSSIVNAGGRRAEIYAKLRSIRDRYGDLVRQRYPNIPRRVSGYNLNELLPENGFNVARALVGSESTCAITLGAKLRLVHSPPVRSLLVLGYPDIFSAADHVMEILEAQPVGLEALDDLLVDNMKTKGLHPADLKLLPSGKGWLLVEFGGEYKEQTDQKARDLMSRLRTRSDAPAMKLFEKSSEEKLVWEIRESALGASAIVPGQHPAWSGWEDSAVPVNKLGNYLRDLRGLYDQFGYKGAIYGHFGQGCVHTRITFDLTTAAGVKIYRSFIEQATDLVIGYGGVYSGEHGDGQSKAEFLPKLYGNELVQAFREFKSAWDPDWKMNPGKIVDPYKIDENLRLGADYRPATPETHFNFASDQYSFANATLRCVGVGECRRHEKGTMCPSYRVTLEEKHSTRGRAHLLWEMMQGEVIRDGWKSEAVKQSLDLCLACKGCKTDCPVNVDMATYKAEFLSHYWEGRIRPLSAFSMGQVYWWARLGSRMPEVANFFTQSRNFRDIVKKLGGIAQARRIPRLAPQTFKSWFQARGRRNLDWPGVILWPDTFNNHFNPAIPKAAVHVLEDAGFRVLVPKASLCCGRPLYDFGMLDRAKLLLEQILVTLRTAIRTGLPVVALEPSCAAVFRDELLNLLPHNEDAARLSQQTYTLAEFLEKKAPYYKIPVLHGKAVVHGHCHQKAIMKMTSDQHILDRTELDYTLLDSGCCGMAGSFGFEAEHYEISQQIGEHELFPKVREAASGTMILADGFSCREQIRMGTDKHPVHLAQVLAMAIREAKGEQIVAEAMSSDPRLLVATGAAGFLIGGGLLWGMQHRRSSGRKGR